MFSSMTSRIELNSFCEFGQFPILFIFRSFDLSEFLLELVGIHRVHVMRNGCIAMIQIKVRQFVANDKSHLCLRFQFDEQIDVEDNRTLSIRGGVGNVDFTQ